MTITSLFDTVCLGYFASHIPITLLMDSQAIVPPVWIPDFAVEMNSWYIKTFNDPLMASPPIWFQSFIACELIFQIPIFFLAVYGYWNRCNWIRDPLMVYGAHVTTTLVPVLYELYRNDQVEDGQKLVLAAFYIPYLIIPFLITLRMFMCTVPFPPVDIKKSQ
ncbi:hypothetical protein SARC_10331 [Sphaeroforma arctica JP610]|uniref:EXPERA domain-containing protein n=1 Tax=Sphaeroforma arctica JP610 TaxID=667725 RepID=A0A0L0FKA3_9EUKA|nr:hypothetical protein SARC_10331 [Sphaeroforma arctica JP610]KNC77202.1 hypothetical protein SARC_10331 [Sphaeroforma arctica JP610]|eukprot:XP_014151104.1 hypothetical protein SARC_10331 [Sphaeroforma arctica JP610]